MDLPFFLQGAILGFSIAAPVGPIGILCIRRTLQYGRLSGLFSGLGAAAADTIYGLIAAFSVTLISDFLFAQKLWLHILGGCFLIYLGGRTFFSETSEMITGKVVHRSLLSDFISTLFLTLSNPLTIFSFIAIFAGLGLGDVSETLSNAIVLVTGIFTGSCFWWLLISEGVTLFRKKVSQSAMSWINRIAGLIIITFGLIALISCLHMNSN
jgi:threonine/homoserine/homoserine lactone efflux protein